MESSSNLVQRDAGLALSSAQILNVAFLSVDKSENFFPPLAGIEPWPSQDLNLAPKLQVEQAIHYTSESHLSQHYSFHYLSGVKSYKNKTIISVIYLL